MRKDLLIQLSVEAGRRHQSPATGLIHFPTLDRIPFYHNFCFCLSLLRTLSKENVQEAKARLEHLFAFEKEGLFPSELHEYPMTSSYPRSSIPLKRIELHFGRILGDTLREKLQRVHSPPAPPTTIQSSKDAALLGLHLEDLTPLTPYWDPEHQLYSGPLSDERQQGYEPLRTLFDFMMGDDPRFLQPDPIHLEVGLIFTTPPQEMRAQSEEKPLHKGPGFHLFRKVWKEREHLHTLVCQEKKITLEGDLLIYPQEIPDERERRELTFYVNAHPLNRPTLKGEKVTLFRLGEAIHLGTKWRLCFEKERGEGDIVGQITLGNRPSQLEVESGTAYDWRISLRTLRRTPDFRLKLHFDPL